VAGSIAQVSSVLLTEQAVKVQTTQLQVRSDSLAANVAERHRAV